ncbi:hypothetical protein [Dyella japonica]|nr:hypothetical protein [Dyella japonica]
MQNLGSENAHLFRTVFKYGSTMYGLYGDMVLGVDGLVRYYSHPNERRYELCDDRLLFFNEVDEVTAELTRVGEGQVFLSGGLQRVFLLPTLVLDEHPAPLPDYPPMLINSIPKSGTYLVEGVLRHLGVAPIGLHLGSYIYDDNRGIEEADVHRAPQSRRHSLPAGALAALMGRGECVVGHIEDSFQLAAIDKLGVAKLNCIRDLRDVLISLYRFKLSTVDPLDVEDRLWRALPESGRFLGFLLHFADRDVKHVQEVARAIAADVGVRLKFEELLTGQLTEDTSAALAAIDGELATAFSTKLPLVLGMPTSTLSDRPSSHEEHWSAAVQDFFEESGLAEANRMLGY